MTDALDEYVSTVGSVLRGPARERADMLTEIRDALVDAAEDHHQRGGLDVPEARRVAVREFGAPRSIAAGLQEVLAAGQGRRTARLLLAVLGLQSLAAELTGRLGGWRALWGDDVPGAGYLWLSRAVDVFGPLALLAAAVLVLLPYREPRRAGASTLPVRLTAVLAVLLVGPTLGGGVLLTVLSPSADQVVALIGLAAVVVPSGLVLRSAWRSWWTAGVRAPKRP